MRKLKKAFFILLFCIAFVCIFGQAETASQQIPWSLGWGIVLLISGKQLSKLEDEQSSENQEKK